MIGRLRPVACYRPLVLLVEREETGSLSVERRGQLGQGARAEAKSKSARKQSASYKIFVEILRGLYEGRFVPGQRLIETDLAEEFDATRFVVKDALKLLVSEGVAVDNFHRSCRIPRLTRAEAVHIFEVMECLFGLASREAATSDTLDEHLATFNEVCAHLSAVKADEDFFEFGRAASRYFRTIVKISGNTELMRILPSLRVHLVRVQFKAYPTAGEHNYVWRLENIAKAILARDPDSAEALMREHFRMLAADILALPDRAFAGR